MNAPLTSVPRACSRRERPRRRNARVPNWVGEDPASPAGSVPAQGASTRRLATGPPAPLGRCRGHAASGPRRAPGTIPRVTAVCVLCDAFPELSETFVAREVAGLQAAGLDVRVEAIGPAARPAAIDEPADFLSEDTTLSRLGALATLAARHPLRCLADLGARRRWRVRERVLPLRALAPPARRIGAHGEVHLHAHFAAGQPLAASVSRACSTCPTASPPTGTTSTRTPRTSRRSSTRRRSPRAARRTRSRGCAQSHQARRCTRS